MGDHLRVLEALLTTGIHQYKTVMREIDLVRPNGRHSRGWIVCTLRLSNAEGASGTKR